MPLRHSVVQGDSIARLADQYGLAPRTIWDHPDNAELKTKRKDMNVLAVDDVVVIPDKRVRDEACATAKVHTFRRIGVPMLFRIQLLDGGEPRKDQPYTLEVDGANLEGRTDGDGKIERYLPNGAKQGRLVVADGAVDVRVLFGHMDPIDTPAGVQKRLRNMGFDCGDEDGEIGPCTRAATALFQLSCGLPPTGEIDDPTRQKIGACHDTPDELKAALAAAAAGA